MRLDDPARHCAVFVALGAYGIGMNLHCIHVHIQRFWLARLGAGNFPTAAGYYPRAISLPLFPGPSESQQDHVVTRLAAALEG